MFDKAVVLELGAGVGLASIVASMFAYQIFATGFYVVGEFVLDRSNTTGCQYPCESLIYVA